MAAIESAAELLCSVCAEQKWRYRCPACAATTCSLACVRRHKDESGCSGKRPAPPAEGADNWTPLAAAAAAGQPVAFDAADDHRFLDSIAQRRLTAPLPQPPPDEQAAAPAKHLLQLRDECRRRRIVLRLSERGASNGSSFDRNTRMISWTVELVFVDAAGGRYAVLAERIPETLTLRTLLRQLLVRRASAPRLIAAEFEASRLQSFVDAGMGRVVPLLQAHTAAGIRFHKLDVNSSIADNLRNRVIVDFPTITVTLTDLCTSERFPSLSAEEERQSQTLVNDELSASVTPAGSSRRGSGRSGRRGDRFGRARGRGRQGGGGGGGGDPPMPQRPPAEWAGGGRRYEPRPPAESVELAPPVAPPALADLPQLRRLGPSAGARGGCVRVAAAEGRGQLRRAAVADVAAVESFGNPLAAAAAAAPAKLARLAGVEKPRVKSVDYFGMGGYDQAWFGDSDSD